jgi:uncharacterized protein (TIGR02391 family)
VPLGDTKLPPRPPAFSAGQLEALCKCLADTSSGLTGSEIERLLLQVNVKDVDPGLTKWKRLFSALSTAHNRDKHGGRVLAFITAALEPSRYAGQHDVFEGRRQELNVTLAFVGLEFRPDGKFGVVSAASTLGEAEARANRLKSQLSARGVHAEVLKYCRPELLQNNCFHGVLEASKGVAERLRGLAGSGKDGAELVDEVFSGSSPKLRINAFVSDSEQSEQRGFMNLVKGLFGTFRNPTAHAPRVAWPMSEEDALDLFSLCSYVHRRLDNAR